MKRAPLLCLLVLAWPGSAYGQGQGLTPEWDIREALNSLRNQIESMQPYIEQVDPASWRDQSAPTAYAGQWKSLRDEIGYLDRSVRELSESPESLSKSVESFLRLLSVEEMMESFLEGVRRYHNPAIADALTSIMNESSDSRAGMRSYLLELTSLKESEFAIAMQEAQQCRSERMARPPSSGR